MSWVGMRTESTSVRDWRTWMGAGSSSHSPGSLLWSKSSLALSFAAHLLMACTFCTMLIRCRWLANLNGAPLAWNPRHGCDTYDPNAPARVRADHLVRGGAVTLVAAEARRFFRYLSYDASGAPVSRESGRWGVAHQSLWHRCLRARSMESDQSAASVGSACRERRRNRCDRQPGFAAQCWTSATTASRR